MPAVITHHFFAVDLLQRPEAPRGTSRDEREAFLLGSQGPDPLFYLVAAPGLADEAKLGSRMHAERPSELLWAMRAALRSLPAARRAVGDAYVAGFLCHYLLDSTAHPFVYAWQNALCDAGVEGLTPADGSEVHAEVERDLDEMVLYDRLHETVATWRPYRQTLRASEATLATAGQLYSHAALAVYGQDVPAWLFGAAVHAYRLVLHVLWSPDGRRSAALAQLERQLRPGHHSLARALSHRARASATSAFANDGRNAWNDPSTHEPRDESFWDLYEAAQAQAPQAIRALLAPTATAATARELTGGRNFEGVAVEGA